MFENIFEKKKIKIKEKLKIIADKREKNSLVISELINNNINVELKHLLVADFLIGDVSIERKTVSDFINSMINKRLVRQLQELKQYKKQLLIIEGIEEEELYSDNNEKQGINPNAVRGFLLTILLEFNIPIIFTKDYEDTARFLIILAKKQEKEHISIRVKRKTLSKKEQKQFILEGFPGIGPASAKKLLKKFKTIKNIVNASEEELRKIIGKKADIFKLLGEKY